MILYSIDQDLVRPLAIRNGYRRVGMDETILPDDVFNNFDIFARMDNLPESIIPFTAPTVNDIADKEVRSSYGHGWQILRKKPNGSNEAESEIKVTPELDAKALEREPYKAPAVLGYAEITDPAEQRALMTALESGVTHGWNAAMCHNPRHGLHFETGTLTIAFSICFECQNVYLFGPDDKMGRFAHVGSFAITRAPQAVFNAALKRHGVPLSERPTP